MFNFYKKELYLVSTTLFCFVGMTRFELATTRPPDVYSNRAELHPAMLQI